MCIAEIPDCLPILRISNLVGDSPDFTHAQLRRQSRHATSNFHRPIVGLDGSDEGGKVLASSTRQMLQACFHVDDDVALIIALTHNLTDQAADRGVGAAHSTSAPVIHLTHDEEADTIGSYS